MASNIAAAVQRSAIDAEFQCFTLRLTRRIVPIMFSRFVPDDAPLAQRFARALLDEGIYVKGFFFPVVPRGQSRIRVQLSAAHTEAQIDRAVAAFTKVGKALAVLKG